MIKIDVCIETVFPALYFTEKIKKVAQLGFDAVEFWYWDQEFDGKGFKSLKKDIDGIAGLAKESNIKINNVVVNAPDGSVGGSLNRTEDRGKYIKRLEETIEVARRLNCKKMITCSGNEVRSMDAGKQMDNVIETLKEASKIAEKEDVILLLETLNSHVDHPGYFLNSSKTGFDIVRKIDSPNLKLLYDIYHMQIMEGNIVDTIKKNIELIGHFHSAGVPGRNELDNGEINYPFIVEQIEESGYKDYFGLEYFPILDSETSLKNMKKLLVKL